MIKFYFTLVITFVLCMNVQAQDNWNRLLADPFSDAADTLDYKFRIAPVNSFLDVSSSYVVKEITDQNDTTRLLNWENLLGQTKDKNGFFGQYAFNILQTEIKVKGIVVNAGFGTRSEGYANMDGPGVRLIFGGNGNVVDAASTLAPDIHYNSWYQFNLGAKKYFNRSFLGLNLKLVDGIEHFKFSGAYGITANNIFNEIDIQRNVVLQSTSLVRYNSFDDIEFQPNKPFTDNLGFDNLGMLIDVYGGTRVGNHIFNIAITDIGFIKWEQSGSTREYKSDGLVSYSGIEVSEALSNEFEFNLQDTLDNIIGLELTDAKTYNSSLLTKINLRYQYDLDKGVSIGVNNFFAIDGTYGFFRVSLFGSKELTDWLALGATYSFDKYSAVNVGLNAHLKFGGFRLGLNTQNFLALFDPYAYRVSSINIATEYKF